MSNKTDKPVNHNMKNIAKASFMVAIVTGLSSVIYFAVRDNPKSFPIVMPFDTKPQVPAKQTKP